MRSGLVDPTIGTIPAGCFSSQLNASTIRVLPQAPDKAVSLTIFDVSGRVVKTLVDNQHLQQGVHEIQWDGTNQAGAQVASGTYLYQLKFGNFAHTKTMVLLK